MKKCTKCQIIYPSTNDFFRSRGEISYKNKLRSQCKKCDILSRKKYKESVINKSIFVENKICKKCLSTKQRNCFHKDSKNKDGLLNWCKECVKRYQSDNMENIKEYRIRNRKKTLQRMNARRKVDVNYRLICNYRKRVWDAVKRNRKSKKTKELLGCSIDFLRKYLESKFESWMNWDNYGNPNGDHTNCWHIDHIIPCSKFDLSIASDLEKCFHYTNLRPLSGIENISKGNK